MSQPNLIVVDTIEGLNMVERALETAEFVSFDCETTGVHHGAQIVGYSICVDECNAYYVVLSYWNTTSATLNPISDESYAAATYRIIEVLKGKQLICHNAIFDCAMVETNFKISLIESIHTDTMVLAHLLNENRRIGLKELGAAYFGGDAGKEAEEMKASVLVNGGKYSAGDKEMYKADYKILGKYGAKDALLTYKLFYAMVPELFEQGLDQFFYEDESMPLLRGPSYDLNTIGTRIDQDNLEVLKKTLEAECLEAKDFINKEIALRISDKYPGTNKKNHFNIGSSSQLSWLLFGVYGLEFEKLTDEGRVVAKALCGRLPYTAAAKRAFIAACFSSSGQPYIPESIVNGKVKRAKKIKEPWAYIACDKKTLQKIAPKLKWVEKLLLYQKNKKLLNTYIEGIQERVQYGVIRSSFLQTGTTSGRYSSRNPNWQNLPRDDKRIKACVVARPGKVFVGADYSQLEPRVFAYYSGDERLLAAFDGTRDFYSVIGMQVYGKTDCTPQKDGSPDAFGVKYKQLRDFAKVIALASTYGATSRQLAPVTGKSIDDTQQDIDAYFEEFPGVKEMMIKAHETAKKDGKVVNYFGRPRRMPDAKKISRIYGNLGHADLPYEARGLLNLAVNHTIQSTGASICNRAMIKFHAMAKELGLNCKIVVQVHDEIIVECDENDAESVSLLLQEAMENTTVLPGVTLEAKPKVGKTLAALK